MKNYKDIKFNPLPERELEILGTITVEKMSLMRDKALAKIKESFEIDGFRKGNVPENIIAQKVGEMTLLEEAAEIALSEEYPSILEEHNIDAIGRPEISITKIGLGNPLEFKIKTALMPEVKLTDYKKVSKKENFLEKKTLEVTEKEIEDVISNIRQNMVRLPVPEHSDGGQAHQKAKSRSELGSTTGIHSESGDGKEHNYREITPADLPKVDDDFAKMIGDFKDVADMKSKIKENILRDKAQATIDKKRIEILEEIINESKIELPKIIIDGEMEKMLAQFKDDIGKSGITFEDYLKHVKKTEDNLKLDWKDTAIKRAKSQVILNTIAKEQSISPKEEDIKREMEHILDKYKNSDRFRVRMYVETFMTNELVFQFLESQK